MKTPEHQFMHKHLIAAAVASLLAAGAHGQIVNIDATHGFTYDSGGSDPAPVPGQHINPIGAPVLLTLPAGNYLIRNAFALGLPGALHGAWSFNVGTQSWAWAFVMADHATNQVMAYHYAGTVLSSAAAVAAQPAVQRFEAAFSLAAPATLLFTLRDYYVPDNAGGISLQITSAVPEPATALLWCGALMALGRLARRRR